MPSSIAHGLAAIALGGVLAPAAPRRLHASAVASAVLLDVDAIGRPFGLGDVARLGGHRGLTHSLPFAAVLATLVVILACRGAGWRGRRRSAWAYVALAVALHGALDALTTYGAGVTFLAPFSAWRAKAPWQPLDGIAAEIVGVWIPACALIWFGRRRALVAASSELL